MIVVKEFMLDNSISELKYSGGDYRCCKCNQDNYYQGYCSGCGHQR
jgi:hypothetical protein